MILQLVVFAIFGGFGAMLGFVGVREWWLQRRLLAGARPVPATVLAVEIRKSVSHDTDPRPLRSTSTTSYTADVRFAYEIDGRRYQSDRLRASAIIQGHASRDSAAREVAGLSPGLVVDAWVDPRHPGLGFLKTGRSAGPAVFMTLGVLLPPLAWWIGGVI